MRDDTLDDFIALWRCTSLDPSQRDADELALRRLLHRNEAELQSIRDPMERVVCLIGQESGLQAELQGRVSAKNDRALRLEVARCQARLAEIEALIRPGVKSEPIREGRPIEVVRH